MRRTVPSRPWALGALVAIAVLALGQVSLAAAKKKKEPPPPKINETVGDLAFVVSNGELKVEGVGLVTGLDNTGVDAPQSWHRQQLVEEMSKAGVEKAEKLLANPQVSMVLVRMTIPMGVNPTDRLDVQVEIPPACGTRSLAGGYLLTTRLYQVAVAKGTALRDHELALAQGPVMIGTAAKPADPKIGRVLGGGRVKKDYPYTLVIKENRDKVGNGTIEIPYCSQEEKEWVLNALAELGMRRRTAQSGARSSVTAQVPRRSVAVGSHFARGVSSSSPPSM